LTEIAREIGVSESALRSWVSATMSKKEVDGPLSIEDENKRLRKENAELNQYR